MVRHCRIFDLANLGFDKSIPGHQISGCRPYHSHSHPCDKANKIITKNIADTVPKNHNNKNLIHPFLIHQMDLIFEMDSQSGIDLTPSFLFS